MSESDWGESFTSKPRPVSDQPDLSSDSIFSAQVVMDGSLWHTIGDCQRHPITEFRNNSPMNMGDRIKAERKAKGLERNDLVRLTGIKYPTLAGIENGDQASSTKIHVLADALEVRPEWLETGELPKEPKDAAGETGWSDILGYSQSVGLGRGAEAVEYAETHKLKFRAASLARKRIRPQGLAVMYGSGDSMEPRIKAGDAVMFDTTDTTPKDGGIYVIQWKGEIYAKRAEVLDDAVYFRADNPQGDHNWRKPKRMDAKRDPVQILGRVRWIGSWED